MLETVGVVLDGNIHIANETGDAVGVLGADAVEVHMVAHGPVDGPGVHIDKAQILGHSPGHGAFAAAGGAVDGNGVVAFRCHVFSSLLVPAAARPAARPVAQAICKLKPPV